MSESTTGVVLLNMGGPDSLGAVEPFLFNLFRDNDIIPLPLGGFLLQRPLARFISSRRASYVRGYYERIGGRSPIADITREQARLLEERLNGANAQNARTGALYKCHVAMRYWHPFTGEAIEALARQGVNRVVALTLYPHFTTATTGSSLRELRRAIAGKPPALGAVEVIEIDRFFDDPAYLDALSACVREGLASFPDEVRKEVVVLFTAHGLPVSFIRKGDPYVEHLLATIAGVSARLAATEGNVRRWLLSYQSRVGSNWLEPGTEATLEKLAKEGTRHILAVPISFVSDHIETLYEIDLLFGDHAKELGLDMRRPPSLNARPDFIEALAGLVERAVSAVSST